MVVVIDDEAAIVEAHESAFVGLGARTLGSATGDDVIAAVHGAGECPICRSWTTGSVPAETASKLPSASGRRSTREIPAILITGSITPDLAERRARRVLHSCSPVMADDLRRHIGATLGLDPGRR